MEICNTTVAKLGYGVGVVLLSKQNRLSSLQVSFVKLFRPLDLPPKDLFCTSALAVDERDRKSFMPVFFS